MSGRSTSRPESRKKGLLGNLLGRKRGGSSADARELLAQEVAELEAIAGALFRKMEDRMEALKALEERLDVKARGIEDLLARAKRAVRVSADAQDAKRREAVALSRKGLKVDEIASILDIPRGEAELMLNLGDDRKPPSR